MGYSKSCAFSTERNWCTWNITVAIVCHRTIIFSFENKGDWTQCPFRNCKCQSTIVTFIKSPRLIRCIIASCINSSWGCNCRNNIVDYNFAKLSSIRPRMNFCIIRNRQAGSFILCISLRNTINRIKQHIFCGSICLRRSNKCCRQHFCRIFCFRPAHKSIVPHVSQCWKRHRFTLYGFYVIMTFWKWNRIGGKFTIGCRDFFTISVACIFCNGSHGSCCCDCEWIVIYCSILNWVTTISCV